MKRSPPEDARDAATRTAWDDPVPVARPGRWHGRLTRPAVLFPLIAVVALGLLWSDVLNLVGTERRNAHRAALASSGEILETYEAQVVRVLREVDRALKVLQYSYRMRGDGQLALADLEEAGLMLPGLVFTVKVADERGELVASTGEPGDHAVLDPRFLDGSRAGDDLQEAAPVRSGDEWRLRFGRRLSGPDGSFGGVALVEVDAAFLVSGYETAKHGEQGVIAVVGSDGVFRVRRTGNRVIFGGRTDYGSLVDTAEGFDETSAELTVSPWDGVARYTAARQLFDFPLAVVVGLAEEEQLALAEEHEATYLARAVAGSVLLLAVIAALGWMSWNLERSRRRESENRVAYAQRVEHLAYHDELTALPNRSLLNRLLEERIRHASRYGSQFAVLFLDLDRFKQINDTLGHDAGDELLREVARRLEAALRASDTVARMGGDEFVILVPQVEHEDEVATVARKVLAALWEPFVLLGERFSVTVSVGVSLFPRDGRDEQTLMKHADIALYEAKDAGRNSIRFFSQEMSVASVERLKLESSLRAALQNDELELHYQPRRDLDSNRITGVEALLRWKHPQLGTIGPAAFLSLAEETGLILPIGRWVLRAACRQSVAWTKAGLPPLSVAVNLSAQQFHDENLLGDVATALVESGAQPGRLELEICESVLTRDSGRTLPILQALKELGVRITVDNFGIGYTSLSVLRQLPVDTIKIDRLFLREDSGDVVAREVTDAIASMARTLTSSVVAQGVETKEQVDHLRKRRGNEVQGFFFDRPVPVAAFTELLRAEAGSAVGLVAAV